MDLDATLETLAREPSTPVDLAEMALRLARDEYPDLDVEAYLSELTGLAHEARPFLGKSLESRVDGLCRFLFHEVGFGGNQNNYYDPRNSYLNEVLDRQTGIPITLSLVTMAVGSRVGLRIEGVALPGHFVVMARAGSKRILFDPYHDGKRLELDDCAYLVRQSAGLNIELTPEVLRPATAGSIVTRVLTNLKGCYLREEDYRRAVRVIGRLRQIAPADWSQARDLGACELRLGRPGKAISAFETYLKRVPDAADADAVTKLLKQARGEVARWN